MKEFARNKTYIGLVFLCLCWYQVKGTELFSFGESIIAGGPEPDTAVVEESVDVALRLADSNGDGVIGLAELDSVIQGYVDLITGPGGESEFDTWKNYAMTLADLLDGDDTKALERKELEKLMATFLRQSGTVQAARLIESELYLKLTLSEIRLPRGRKLMSVAFAAMDTDDNREITMDEARSYYGHNKLDYFWLEVEVLAQDADVNGDNKLMNKEVYDWVSMIRENSEWDVRRMFIYTQIKERLGGDLANQWLDI